MTSLDQFDETSLIALNAISPTLENDQETRINEGQTQFAISAASVKMEKNLYESHLFDEVVYPTNVRSAQF